MRLLRRDFFLSRIALNAFARRQRRVRSAKKKEAGCGREFDFLCMQKVCAQQNSEVVRVLQCWDARHAGECGSPLLRSCRGLGRKVTILN